MSDFITVTTFRKLPSYQNRKEFNPPVIETNLVKRELSPYKLVRNTLQTKQECGIELSRAKMALVSAARDGYGCDSVVVSIEACGASGPGSNPGRGPKGD